MIIHPIAPVFDEHSRILILGSFPSVRSREEMFFYGHPQNRFWQVLASIFACDVPATVEEKKNFLLSHHIALWDVIASCEITGSADSSIKKVIPNDLSVILDHADIRAIFVNGKIAEKYYNKYLREKVKRDAICLPSTSPANAAWRLQKLTEAWQILNNH